LGPVPGSTATRDCRRSRSPSTAPNALARKLDELEGRYRHHDDAIAVMLATTRELKSLSAPKRRGIGFTVDFTEKS
jgi:hypothetical protein